MRAVVLAAVMLLATFPSARAESPTDGTCDGTGLLVCAGANAGGHVACDITAAGVATCAWTRGNIWTAFSQTLPGSADVTSGGTVQVCVDQACTTTVSSYPAESCAWLPASTCDGANTDAGTVGPVQLQLGQTLRVVVASVVHVEARAHAGDVEFARVVFDNAGEGAGAVSFVDDGR